MRAGIADAATSGSAAVVRLRSWAVCIALTALAFLQEPGKIVADTKIDLTVDPAGFLLRAMHLWDPNGSFGQLQNQAYGYLWPMGPFFLGGSAMGLPAWMVQRLWWALLMCVAYTGTVRLARNLNIGTPTSRLIAGVAFALSPRVITLLGANSIEAWPMAVAPWVVVPLAGLAHGARIRPAVVRSAVAVACAGGVNGTAVLAILPPAAIWLAMLEPRRRRVTALAAWGAAVAAATAWWVVPLVIFGSYSPPLLDYTETAAVTTQVTDVVSVLRGAAHWVAYIGTSYGPQWPAAARLATDTWLVVATLVVAALGIVGLSRRGVPHRRYLVSLLLLGVTLVAMGHASALDGPVSGAVRDFLNGPGAPLRNVHKFDVAIRLALVLGLAHVVGLMGRLGAVVRRGFRPARASAVLVTATAVAAVAGAATPALASGLAPPGAFDGVPKYWYEAADWLDANATEGRVLVVPGAQFPHYLWGTTGDEIAQAVLNRPWAVRNVLPMTPPMTIRLLDTVESALSTGNGSAGLADLLARSGVGYLLVRSDLNYGQSSATSPNVVHQALERAPGIGQVVGFGPVLREDGESNATVDYGLGGPVRALEIFRVSRPVPAVAAYDLEDTTTVVGGPESLVDLAAAGQLSAAPTILAGDLAGRRPPGPVAMTDGLRRREVGFGAPRDRESATLTRDEPLTTSARAHDFLPAWGDAWLTTARYEGIARVRASSSRAQAGLLFGTRPERQPFAAFDGDYGTSWRPAPGVPPAGQWIEVEFDDPRPVSKVQVHFDLRGGGAAPTKVTVIAGLEETTVKGFGTTFTADLPGQHAVQSVRVVVDEVVSDEERIDQFALSEIVIPGVHASRTLDLPRAPAVDRPATVVLSAAPSTPDCFFVQDRPRCAPGMERASEDGGRIDRSLTLPASATYRLDVWARPAAGADLNALLDNQVALANALHLGTLVGASSSAVTDPAGRPGAVVDGDPNTIWLASANDPSPTLQITFPSERLVTGLKFLLPDDATATRPGVVRIVGDDTTTGGLVSADGAVVFASPIRTRHLTVILVSRPVAPSLNSYGNFVERVSVGVGELYALSAPPNTPTNLDERVSLGCGSGPTIAVGGRAVRTQMAATVRDLLERREVEARPCGDNDGPVSLAGGPQRVVASPSTLAEPTRVALVPDGPVGEPVDTPVRTRWWGPTERHVVVGPHGSDRVLVLRENANSGWLATVDGRRLDPLVVDGWQQAWVLPAGVSGEVVIRYAPDAAYRLALIAGGALFVIVLGLTLVPGRRTGAHARRVPSRPARGAAMTLVTGVLALVATGGAWGALVALAAVPALVFGIASLRPGARLAIRGLETWVPVALVGLAGWLWLVSDDPRYDGRPQALGLLALAGLWLSCLSAARQPVRAPLQDRLLHQVVADRRKHQASRDGQQERAEEITAEQRPVPQEIDLLQHEWVPQKQSVRDRA